MTVCYGEYRSKCKSGGVRQHGCCVVARVAGFQFHLPLCWVWECLPEPFTEHRGVPLHTQTHTKSQETALVRRPASEHRCTWRPIPCEDMLLKVFLHRSVVKARTEYTQCKSNEITPSLTLLPHSSPQRHGRVVYSRPHMCLITALTWGSTFLVAIIP